MSVLNVLVHQYCGFVSIRISILYSQDLVVELQHLDHHFDARAHVFHGDHTQNVLGILLIRVLRELVRQDEHLCECTRIHIRYRYERIQIK